MKVLVNKTTSVAMQAYADDANVAQDNKKVLDEHGIHFFLGKNGGVLYKNVFVPADFAPGKYLFDGTTFTANPAFRTRAQVLSRAKDAAKLTEETGQ